ERILRNDRPVIIFENGQQASANFYDYTSEEFFEFFARHGYRLSDLLGAEFYAELWNRIVLPWYLIAVPEERPWADIQAVIESEIDASFPEINKRLYLDP